jgi:hypothetical protein
MKKFFDSYIEAEVNDELDPTDEAKFRKHFSLGWSEKFMIALAICVVGSIPLAIVLFLKDLLFSV